MESMSSCQCQFCELSGRGIVCGAAISRLRFEDTGEKIPATTGAGEGVVYGFLFARGHFNDESTVELVLAEFIDDP